MFIHAWGCFSVAQRLRYDLQDGTPAEVTIISVLAQVLTQDFGNRAKSR